MKNKVFWCKNCVVMSTRPRVTFNKEGLCSACQWVEEKRNIDWEFEGSVFKGGAEDGKAILWNFNKSYLILKYYRI